MNPSPFGLALFDTTTKAAEGQWLTLKNPATGKDTDIQIKLIGPDSPQFRELEKEIARRRASTQIADGDVAGQMELQRELRIDVAVGATIDWRNVPDTEGKPVAFNQGNVTLLYRNYPEILEQVERFVNTKRNWLLGVEGNSQPGESGASG